MKISDFKLIQTLPVIEVKNNDITLNMLIDSGATHCLINPDIMDKLTFEESDEVYHGYDVNNKQFDVKTILMDILVGNIMFQRTPFQIMIMDGIKRLNDKGTDCNIDGILGGKFLCSFKLKINYNTNTLELDD